MSRVAALSAGWLRVNLKPGNFAGGSPAASYFSCSAKKSNQKKAGPGSPALRASLRCSLHRAAAQLARQFDDCILSGAGMYIFSGQFRALAQCSPTSPGATPLLGGSQGS